MISVVITAYDRKQYLDEAVASAFNQTRQPDEVIVITNFEYSSNYPIKHILDKEAEPLNISKFVWKAIESAKGDIIAPLEDDDKFLPNRIEKIANAFSDPNVIFFYNSNIGRKPDKNDNLKFGRGSSQMAFKKDILDKRFLEIKAIPDTAYYFLALEKTEANPNLKIVATDEVLTEYRVHTDNLSINSNRHEAWKKARDMDLLNLPKLFPTGKAHELALEILRRDYGH